MMTDKRTSENRVSKHYLHNTTCAEQPVNYTEMCASIVFTFDDWIASLKIMVHSFHVNKNTEVMQSCVFGRRRVVACTEHCACCEFCAGQGCLTSRSDARLGYVILSCNCIHSCSKKCNDDLRTVITGPLLQIR